VKKTLYLFFILVCFEFLFSQTTIPEGNVSGNWELNGSPYLIEGEITIPDGETLTIEPGITVEFQGFYSLYVQGRLLALGTEQDSICFTVADTSGFFMADTTCGAWDGIHFIETPTTNDSSKIIYSILEFSKAPIEQYSNWNGGAIYIYDYSKVLVSHCLITNNRAQSGGGICIMENSNPIIDSNTISFNITTGIHSHGSGICIRDYSNPIISNNSIHDNIMKGQINYGGGLHISEHSEPIVVNNIIRNNSKTCGYGAGSGLSIYNSDPIISSNRIEFNSGASEGGGLFIWYNAEPTLFNNIISNNTSGYGAAISYSSAKPILINNTITNNTATHHGGGIYRYVTPSIFGNIKIVNSIFYNNQPEEIYIYDYGPDTFTIANSIIEGGETGLVLNGNILNWLDGNLDTNPMFVDSLNYDFHLQDISSAIGAGIDSLEIEDNWYFSPEIDFEGNLRPYPFDSMPDIGAFENPLGEPLVGVNYLNIPKYVYYLSNFPNPFNPTTTISFSILNDSNVELSIFNIKGQKVKTLVYNEYTKGSHSICWNGVDEFGKMVSSGIYYYKLNVNGKTEAVKKCLLLK
jgi:parallel beta-helix repeat protein